MRGIRYIYRVGVVARLAVLRSTFPSTCFLSLLSWLCLSAIAVEYIRMCFWGSCSNCFSCLYVALSPDFNSSSRQLTALTMEGDVLFTVYPIERRYSVGRTL
ncbi:hypothetical protein BGZ61DRAFT_446625 [Ilyonectria robusta]|uniref:uncharacterized protein n=1 Tax=Ilyonectria robusta TaxID=1079257 RepID=UPI001E8E0B76|nr:uncharacterized protein BGZ61DRAFT_446625 [Ilyonectria robusta]KAH8729574.1 hypothetical protein BGZ61DRAFT_446625 [Ilyonectria robusta]